MSDEEFDKVVDEFDPELARALGVTLLVGMREVEQIERFTGTAAIRSEYYTHFPMPDGKEWEFVLRRKC